MGVLRVPQVSCHPHSSTEWAAQRALTPLLASFTLPAPPPPLFSLPSSSLLFQVLDLGGNRVRMASDLLDSEGWPSLTPSLGPWDPPAKAVPWLAGSQFPDRGSNLGPWQ